MLKEILKHTKQREREKGGGGGEGERERERMCGHQVLGSEVIEGLNLIRGLDQRRRCEEQAEATIHRSKVSGGSKYGCNCR